jgi:hypothetical protein
MELQLNIAGDFRRHVSARLRSTFGVLMNAP